MTREITNTEDIIDSREIIERIEELESVLAEGEGEIDDVDELQDELASLKHLAEQAEAAPDWAWGEALIRDDYFEEYAQELARDIGAIQSDQGWPNHHIDWEKAADELKQDYMCVDFDGVEYWIRA